jgi:tellurite resistance protein TerC
MSLISTLAASTGDDLQHFAQIDVAPWEWFFFLGLVATLLFVDLLLLHREPRVMSIKEAAVESSVWIAIGLLFGLFVFWQHGATAGGEYLSGYLIEESLSVDNVFVWAVIFTYFAVPRQYQFRTLFWGIFGALVLRAGFIFAGVALVKRFDAVLYAFGVVLLWSAYRIARHDETQVDPERNPALRLVRRLVPSTTEYDGQKLFTRQNARRLATPLFAVLVMVETTDLVFAIDSIPAVLAVSRESFIVFSSNAFAILGLRALYFCLAGMANRFRYLNLGIGLILAFVGLKMILSHSVHLATWVSLVAIATIIAASVLASLFADWRDSVAARREP